MLILALWVSAITTCQAEVFPLADVVPASVPDEQREMLQSHAQKLANGMFNHLLLRLDELDRICTLTNDQQRILTVAAKGAVQERLDNWLGMIAGFHAARAEKQRQVDEARIVLPPGVGLARVKFRRVVVNGKAEVRRLVEVEPRKGDGFQIIELMPARRLRGNVVDDVFRPLAVGFVEQAIGANREIGGDLNMEGPLLNVSEQVLWTATIDRMLSDEQNKLYAAAQAERAALPREWRHERVMIEFDEMLRLDSTQRPPLAERVAKFLEMSQIKRWLKRKQGFEDAALARMALRAIPSEDVKDILSSRQTLQWQLQLREDLESR